MKEFAKPSKAAGLKGKGEEGGGRGVGRRGERFAAYGDSFKPGVKLEFHAGWSGWIMPPAMGLGGREGCHEQAGLGRGGV